ncbi:MAG: hypothetical protein WA081_07985 [Desulfosalsimonadaceae bacterium]
MTTTQDIVLIYYEDQPFSFARVEEILPDAKKDWYHVKLLLLQIPLQTVSWILKNNYINGDEFTMGGKRMRLELIVAPVENKPDETPPSGKKPAPAKKMGGPKVVSLSDRKPKT